jgi:DNA-binding NarL/FixJ family response regulator
VVVAAGGTEALDMVQNHPEPIQLVITDSRYAADGGPATGRTLRSLRPEIQVLYVSDYTESAVVRSGSLARVTHFCQSLSRRRLWCGELLDKAQGASGKAESRN